MDSELYAPQLVATTNGTYSCSAEESRRRELVAREDPTVFSPGTTAQDSHESNYFKSIQWSEILYHPAFHSVLTNKNQVS